VCAKWEESSGFEDILKVVRMSYPSSIRGELISEFPMESASDSIFYVKPTYGSEPVNKEISLNVKEDDSAVINHLLEWKDRIDDQKKEPLVKKWGTLLDDVKEDDNRKNIATILENQEKHLKGIK
jgi:hypothetical protein